MNHKNMKETLYPTVLIAVVVLFFIAISGDYNFEAFTSKATALIQATHPQLTIISPLAQNYTTNLIWFNITSNEALSSCKYSISNWATNITMTSFNSTYFYNLTNVSTGNYLVRFSCNDTAGNINDTEKVNFTVKLLQSLDISSLDSSFNYPATTLYPLVANGTFSDGSNEDLMTNSYFSTTSGPQMNKVRGKDASFTGIYLLPNDLVLIVGGQNNSGFVSNTSEEYNYSSNTWANVSEFYKGSGNNGPTNLLSISSESTKEVVVGGGGGPATASARLYNYSTKRWQTINSMNYGRNQFAGVLLFDDLWFVATGCVNGCTGSNEQGQSFSTVGQSAEVYNFSTGNWTAKANIGTAISSSPASIKLFDNRVMICGGYDGASSGFTTCRIYNYTSNSWATTGSVPHILRYDWPMFLLYDGRVMSVRTKSETTPSLDIMMWNSSGGTWYNSSYSTSYYHGWIKFLTLPKGEILAAGGSNGTTEFPQVEIFNPRTNSWRYLGNLTMKRAVYTTPIILPNGKILIAGGTNGTYLNTTELITLNQYSINWSSNNTAVAKVDRLTGLLTAVSPGKATITASSEGISVSRTLTIPGTFDDIIVPAVNFTSPTLSNASIINKVYAEVNLTVDEANLDSFKFNWNGTNYSLYDPSLVLISNFDNNTAIGENATLAADVSKYGNNGSCLGTTCPTFNSSGRFGGAYVFDGVNDYFNLSNAPNFNLNNYTISAWIKSNVGSPGFQKIFYKGNGGSVEPVSFYLHQFGNLTIEYYNSGTNYYAVGKSDLRDGKWHHVAGVRSAGSGMYVYVDGILEKSGSDAGQTVTVTNIPTISSRIGADSFFNGTIDEVRVYNRTLSAAEVKQQYFSNLKKHNPSSWLFYSNQSNLSDGTYTYQAFANDTSSNAGLTEIRTLTVDTIASTIALISPSNNTADNDGNVTFSYNASDSNSIANCSLVFNGILNRTNSSVTSNSVQNFTLNNLAVGSYNWSINCTDTAGNIGNSSLRIFSVVKTTKFGGSTTDLSTVNVSNITNLIIESSSYGKINFTQNVDLSNGSDVDSYINISFNRIEINSTALSALNKSAILTFYNITFGNPEILVNGVSCPTTQCAKLNYSNGVLTFNVTHFTVYSSQEAPSSQEESASAEKESSSGGACNTNWKCGEWQECSPDGTQIRICTNALCGLPDRTETRSCEYQAPAPPQENKIIEKIVEEIVEKVFSDETIEARRLYIEHILDTLDRSIKSDIGLMILTALTLFAACLLYIRIFEYKVRHQLLKKPAHRRIRPLNKNDYPIK